MTHRTGREATTPAHAHKHTPSFLDDGIFEQYVCALRFQKTKSAPSLKCLFCKQLQPNVCVSRTAFGRRRAQLKRLLVQHARSLPVVLLTTPHQKQGNLHRAPWCCMNTHIAWWSLAGPFLKGAMSCPRPSTSIVCQQFSSVSYTVHQSETSCIMASSSLPVSFVAGQALLRLRSLAALYPKQCLSSSKATCSCFAFCLKQKQSLCTCTSHAISPPGVSAHAFDCNHACHAHHPMEHLTRLWLDHVSLTEHTSVCTSFEYCVGAFIIA
jgi:hypothetical protein